MTDRSGLGSDTRGVSELVGFIFVFAILVILLSINQAQIVPAENEQVEFRHSQEVQGQLQELRNGVVRAAGSGATVPVNVELGTRYPQRILAVNPPPATGTLRTTAVGNPPVITIDNAIAQNEETADYWDGDPQTFETRSIVYTPNYRSYSGAPNTTVYENTILYNRFDNGATISLSEQLLVQDRTITLVALDGDLQRSGTSAESVDVRSLSGSYREIMIENRTNDPIEIAIPSHIDREEFLEAVELPNHVSVSESGSGHLILRLSPDTYTLRMAKIGVGTGATAPSAHYITLDEGLPAEVTEGTNHSITVEIRDRFNNPIGGYDVSGTADEGTITPDEKPTKESGKATFVYTAPNVPGGNEVDDTITISMTSNPGQTEAVTLTTTVVREGGGGGPPGKGGPP